jgi:hypothetical protein
VGLNSDRKGRIAYCRRRSAAEHCPSGWNAVAGAARRYKRTAAEEQDRAAGSAFDTSGPRAVVLQAISAPLWQVLRESEEHDSDERYKSPIGALKIKTAARLLWRAAGWPTALLQLGSILLLIAGGCLFSRYELAGDGTNSAATTAM